MSTDAIEYCVNGGHVHAGGVTERQRCLLVKADDRTVSYDKFRSASDEPGAAIGLFRTGMPPEELRRLLDLARSLDIGKLPPGTAGGPGVTVMSFRLLVGGQLAQAQFSSMDMAHIQRLEPLIDSLERLAFNTERSPEAAARLTVTAQTAAPGAATRFSFALSNIGRQPICFGDPRALSVGDPDLHAAIAVAHYPPEKPGFTAPPLQWQRIALDRPATAGAPVQLAPGQSFRADSAPWVATKPGRHLVQALWTDYRPLDIANCRTLRGALFSTGLEVSGK